MDKRRKTGLLFAGLSVAAPLLSLFFFLIIRGPNADIYLAITTFGILSVLGIGFAILSWASSKRFLLPLLGFLGNSIVLVFTFFLLLAMGISEA